MPFPRDQAIRVAGSLLWPRRCGQSHPADLPEGADRLHRSRPVPHLDLQSRQSAGWHTGNARRERPERRWLARRASRQLRCRGDGQCASLVRRGQRGATRRRTFTGCCGEAGYSCSRSLPVPRGPSPLDSTSGRPSSLRATRARIGSGSGRGPTRFSAMTTQRSWAPPDANRIGDGMSVAGWIAFARTSRLRAHRCAAEGRRSGSDRRAEIIVRGRRRSGSGCTCSRWSQCPAHRGETMRLAPGR